MNRNEIIHKKIQWLDKNRNSNIDMYIELGFLEDLFSSSYTKNSEFNENTIQMLWEALFLFFTENEIYNNKFQAICIMHDLYFFSRRSNIFLDRKALMGWYKSNKTDTDEIKECIDNILM